MLLAKRCTSNGAAARSRFSAGTLFTSRLDCGIAGHQAKLDLQHRIIRCRSMRRSSVVLAGACRRATSHQKSGMESCCVFSRAYTVQERANTCCSLSRQPFVWEEATCKRNLTGRPSGDVPRPCLASNANRRSQPPCSTKPSQTQFFCCMSQLLPLSCLACLQSWLATGANWPGQTAFGGVTHPNQAVQGTATLNPCSNGAPTAGHQARCDNARKIFASKVVQRRHVTRNDRAWQCRFSFGCATSFGWPESVAHPQGVVLYASEGLARLF